MDKAAQPIILVHGFRGAPVGLADVESSLRELGYQNIFTPAIPPFAGAEKLPAYTPGNYADFLYNYCQKNHLDAPLLIGHSMGSIVVAATLQKYPDYFHQKSILLSPISTRTALPFRIVSPLSGLLPNRLIDYITTKFIIVTKDPDDFTRIMDITHQCGNLPPTKKELLKATSFSTTFSVADFPSDHDFLFLAGAKDRLIPKKQTEQLAQKFSAKTHFLSNTGHIHTYEQPQATAEAIDRFLQGNL